MWKAATNGREKGKKSGSIIIYENLIVDPTKKKIVRKKPWKTTSNPAH